MLAEFTGQGLLALIALFAKLQLHRTPKAGFHLCRRFHTALKRIADAAGCGRLPHAVVLSGHQYDICNLAHYAIPA